MTDLQGRLYQRLPTIYRRHDEAQGWPLQVLFSVIEQELAGMEEQVKQAYANCFIETCEPSFIAYIADLLDAANLISSDMPSLNQRRLIANIMHYRRRKGQQSVTENIINDLTACSAKIVKSNDLIATTQHLQNLHFDNNILAPIKDISRISSLLTPFESIAHTAQILATGRYANHYNMDTIGLYLWQGNSYSMLQARADTVNDKCFTFHPSGVDIALYNKSKENLSLIQSSVQKDMAIPLHNNVVAEDIVQSIAAGSIKSEYYGAGKSFCIYRVKKTDTSYEVESVPLNQLKIMDLADWKTPPSNIIGVDVERGRISFMADNSHYDEIWVDYYYGQIASIGGGHYDRRTTLLTASENTKFFELTNAHNDYTLDGLIEAYNNDSMEYIIQINDNQTYEINLSNIININGKKLTIQAGDNCWPCIKLKVPLTLANNIENFKQKVVLNGLLIDGALQLSGTLELDLIHCTLLPKIQTPTISTVNNADTKTNSIQNIKVSLINTISGAIYLPSNGLLSAYNSIIDGKASIAIAGDNTGATGPRLQFEHVTVQGKIQAAEIISAIELIATAAISLAREDRGYMRYSYAPTAFTMLNCYRCYHKSVALNEPSLDFISTEYGKIGYMQLSSNCNESIRNGASNGAEMGAFQAFNLSQRKSRVQDALAEYLPYSTQCTHITFLPN